MSTGAVLTVLVLAPSLTGCDSLPSPVFAHSVYMRIAYTHTSLSFSSFFLSLYVMLMYSRQAKQVHMTVSKPSFFCTETVSRSIAQTGLKLVIIVLLQPPECWNYRGEPSFQR